MPLCTRRLSQLRGAATPRLGTSSAQECRASTGGVYQGHSRRYTISPDGRRGAPLRVTRGAGSHPHPPLRGDMSHQGRGGGCWRHARGSGLGTLPVALRRPHTIKGHVEGAGSPSPSSSAVQGEERRKGVDFLGHFGTFWDIAYLGRTGCRHSDGPGRRMWSRAKMAYPDDSNMSPSCRAGSAVTLTPSTDL